MAGEVAFTLGKGWFMEGGVVYTLFEGEDKEVWVGAVGIGKDGTFKTGVLGGKKKEEWGAGGQLNIKIGDSLIHTAAMVWNLEDPDEIQTELKLALNDWWVGASYTKSDQGEYSSVISAMGGTKIGAGNLFGEVMLFGSEDVGFQVGYSEGGVSVGAGVNVPTRTRPDITRGWVDIGSLAWFIFGHYEWYWGGE